MMTDEMPDEEIRRYAPVLEAALDILGKHPTMQLGHIIDLAMERLKMNEMPEVIRNAILTLLFQTAASLKIPGAPEA